MKRYILTLFLAGVCSPVVAQDLQTKLDLESIEYSNRQIAEELSRMNREGVMVRRGGSNGGMFAGQGPLYNTALDPEGNIVHWSYYAPGMHEKRVKYANRLKRAQEKKAKTEERRAAMRKDPS